MIRLNDFIEDSLTKTQKNDRKAMRQAIIRFQKISKGDDKDDQKKFELIENVRKNVLKKKYTQSISENFLLSKKIAGQKMKQNRAIMQKKKNRQIAMIDEIQYQDYVKDNTKESLKTFFKKKLRRAILRIEKMMTFTKKFDFIIIDMIAQEVEIEITKFMKQIDDSNNILNSNHVYEQDHMLKKKFIVMNFSTSLSSDKYITIINEIKFNNDVFSVEKEYQTFFVKAETTETTERNDEENDENEENENDEKNEKNENDEENEDDKKNEDEEKNENENRIFSFVV